MTLIQVTLTREQAAALLSELLAPGNAQADVETPRHHALVQTAAARVALALEVDATRPPPSLPEPPKKQRGRPRGPSKPKAQASIPATPPPAAPAEKAATP